MIRLTSELFAGDWRLTRRIDDARGQQSGSFEGTARFEPDGLGLRYRESGTLTLDAGGEFAATRRYLWRLADGRVQVFFDDGRPFHDFAADGVGSDHPCGADLYRVRYDFSQWPEWQATWTVRGPNKEYVSQSRYRRVG